jgi:uncharacterized protein (DUF362 family)/NAD-dependent dihydropyrimidine dehydrogenase PreA subunit
MTVSVNENKVSLSACYDYKYSVVKQTIKPNFLKPSTADQVVSPHPVVVRAIAEICIEAGAGKIIIGDSPGFGSARKVAEKCGILKVAKDLGVDLVDFTEAITVSTPDNFFHKKFTIARDAVEADIIINLPKFKTHAMMVLTLAVKNLYGFFVGKQKVRWHFQSGGDYNHFARLLVELAYTVNPGVSILDAVIGMEGNGPGSGNPRRFGFLAASRDMTCLDRVATEIAGVDPKKMHTLQAAEDIGYNTDLRKISVIGDSIEKLKIQDLKLAGNMNVDGPLFLKPLSRLLGRYITTKPFVEKMICRGCAICVKSCPANCITQTSSNKPVAINHNNCIRCFCCQELCPEGAIRVKDSIGVNLFRRFGLE